MAVLGPHVRTIEEAPPLRVPAMPFLAPKPIEAPVTETERELVPVAPKKVEG